MENLIHLIYTSKATVAFAFDKARIAKILEASRRNNPSIGITGMLVLCENSFFQVLEGPEESVQRLFEKIDSDNRHEKTVIVTREPIEERSFADWSMGFAELSISELSELEGMNDFFVGGSCLADVNEGRAKMLLRAYAEGRWQ